MGLTTRLPFPPSGTCKLWSLQSGELIRSYKPHAERAVDVAFHPDYTSDALNAPCPSPSPSESLELSTVHFASGGVDNLINLYSAARTEPVGVLRGHNARLSRVLLCQNRTSLFSTSFDTSWRLWDLETQTDVLVQDGHAHPVYGIALHPDCSLVVTGDLVGNGRLWDLRTGHCIWDLVGHVKQILALDFSPNG